MHLKTSRKRLPLWLTVGALAACQTAPVELPPWDLPPAATDTIQAGVELPNVRPPTVQGDGAYMSAEGLAELEAYAVTAEANKGIADENAAALEARNLAYNELINAGRMQREVAVIRADMLAAEKREHFIDNLVHRAVIVLGLVLAVTL